MKPDPKKRSQGPITKKTIYVKLSATMRLNGNQGRKIEGLRSKSGVEDIKLERKTDQPTVMNKIEASNGVVYVPVHIKGSEEAVQKAFVLIQQAIGKENVDEDIKLPPTRTQQVSTTTAPSNSPKKGMTSASKVSSSAPPKIPKKKSTISSLSSTIWSSVCASWQYLRTITIKTFDKAIKYISILIKKKPKCDARTVISVLIICGILCYRIWYGWVHLCQNPHKACNLWNSPCDKTSIKRSIQYRNVCQPFQTLAVLDLIYWAIILLLTMFFLSCTILLLFRGVAYAPATITFLSLSCAILFVRYGDPCKEDYMCELNMGILIILLFLSLLIILQWNRLRPMFILVLGYILGALRKPCSIPGLISGVLRMPFEIYQAKKIHQTVYVKTSRSKNLSGKQGKKKKEIINKSGVDDIQIESTNSSHEAVHLTGSRQSVRKAIEMIQETVGKKNVSTTKPSNTMSVQESVSATVNTSEPQPNQKSTTESPVQCETKIASGNKLARESTAVESHLDTAVQEEEEEEEEEVPSEIGINSCQGMTRETITDASMSSLNDRSNVSKAYSNFTLNEDDPLLIFLRSQESCIKGSVDEFYTWLVKSEDIDSMLALKEAVNEDDYLNDMKVGDGGGSGVKGFKRKAFLRAISEYFNDESDTKSKDDESKNKASTQRLDSAPPPEEFVCPISLNLMTKDPVVAADGITTNEHLSKIGLRRARQRLLRLKIISNTILIQRLIRELSTRVSVHRYMVQRWIIWHWCIFFA